MSPSPEGSSTPGIPDDHVIVAQIGKPFGTAGDVYVFGDADLDEPFDPGTVYRAVGLDQPVLTVRRSRSQGDRLVVGFQGRTTRADAETLRGVVLSRHRDEIVLDADAVWVAELVGRTVVDDGGTRLGVVARIEDGHAHDFVVVALDSGRVARVPMVTELIEWAGDPLVLHPIPGLVDDEAM